MPKPAISKRATFEFACGFLRSSARTEFETALALAIGELFERIEDIERRLEGRDPDDAERRERGEP